MTHPTTQPTTGVVQKMAESLFGPAPRHRKLRHATHNYAVVVATATACVTFVATMTLWLIWLAEVVL